MYERKQVNTLAKEYEQVLDIYTVDKYGSVYGNNGIELKQNNNNKGYKQVSLKLKNKRRYKAEPERYSHALSRNLVAW